MSSRRHANKVLHATEMAVWHNKQLAELKKQRLLLNHGRVRSARKAENKRLQLAYKIENEWLRLACEAEKHRKGSNFELALIEMAVVWRSQHMEMLMLESTHGETLLSSTLNDETQADVSQLARYN